MQGLPGVSSNRNCVCAASLVVPVSLKKGLRGGGEVSGKRKKRLLSLLSSLADVLMQAI